MSDILESPSNTDLEAIVAGIAGFLVTVLAEPTAFDLTNLFGMPIPLYPAYTAILIAVFVLTYWLVERLLRQFRGRSDTE